MTLEKYLVAQMVKANGYVFRADADERAARLKMRRELGKRICALLDHLFGRKKG